MALTPGAYFIFYKQILATVYFLVLTDIFAKLSQIFEFFIDLTALYAY